MTPTTRGRLADGREILYFDDAPGRAPRAVTDTRTLPTRPAASEVRFDALRGEPVVVAAHRQDRTHLPPADRCPLCPSTPERPSEIPASDYDVVVFENRFPALAGGTGRCEVIGFSARHELSFADLSPRRVRTVVEAWCDRTAALNRLPEVEQVCCFENRGEEIGVTLRHPHGQVYGYPFVTPRTRLELDAARRHRAAGGECLFAETLAAERSAGARVVAEGAHWTAFVPAAARWPVEVHLYPHRKVPDLPALGEAERAEFADVYLDVLGRLDRLFGMPLPYVAAWHQAPARADRELAYLRLEVFSIRRAPDKLKYLAASEAAMGVFVSDVVPEELARRLRALAR